MESTNLFIALIILATFCEYITETIFGKWVKGKWISRLSAVIGVILCLSFQLDGMSLLNMSGSAFSPIVGQVITGLIVGGGSNKVHEIFKKLGGIKK